MTLRANLVMMPIIRCEVLNNPFDDIIVRDIQHHAPKVRNRSSNILLV